MKTMLQFFLFDLVSNLHHNKICPFARTVKISRSSLKQTVAIIATILKQYFLKYKWSVVKGSLKGEINSICLWHLSKLKTRPQSAIKLLHSNRVNSENKRIHTPPSSPPFKVEVFLVLILFRQLKQRHNIAWRGWWRKSFIFLFNLKSVKRQQVPLERSVATNFVTDCS